MLPPDIRRQGRSHFRQIFTEFFDNLYAQRAVTPRDIMDLYVARTTAKRIKCELRTGHPAIGECSDLAFVMVKIPTDWDVLAKTPVNWKKSCLPCAALQLGVNTVEEVVGHPLIKAI